MAEEIEAYALDHSDAEPPLLARLNRDAHVKLLRPRMIAGHLQGRALKMCCRMMRPKRLLEIGTYTGYATFCLAEGTDPDAEIHTVEINDEMEPFFRTYWQEHPDRMKIHPHWDDIRRVLPQLGPEPFDLVYIDADKRDYCAYYDLVFPLVRPGGLILADNTLWSGKVVKEDAAHTDTQTSGIMAFNELIRNDNRVEKVLLPLRDGLTVIWKK
ncbi:O-methyltransferase [Tannerella sp. oral taxon BU063 isolate Cell 2]|uniref:O-methyltransferase n=1 Tax=Tannerella sp. oral taxon BU063 isolate Cell 2 TaxID=1411148 RepID=W2C4J9_9BACT|nr:O-methyltransferase [Tannerella sp. oral taxon BU063 isolate Cell 2]